MNPHTMIREGCAPQRVTRQETIGEKKVESKTPVAYTSVLKLTGERCTEYRALDRRACISPPNDHSILDGVG